MKICDSCGKKLGYPNQETALQFPIIKVKIEAILDMCGHKKEVDLCPCCQKDIYNMIMDSEVQQIDYEI